MVNRAWVMGCRPSVRQNGGLEALSGDFVTGFCCVFGGLFG